MRSTPKGTLLKVSIIVFAVVVCIGATAIQAWQDRPAKVESQSAAAGGMFIPEITPALWSYQPDRPNIDRHRALALLAGSADGCTVAIMLAPGFPVVLLAALVRAELGTAHRERMVASGPAMQVIRMPISEAGWQALAER